MAGRAFFTPEKRHLDTDDPDDREIVASYADAAEPTPRGIFMCDIGKTPMYAKRRGTLVFLSHYPDEGHGCRINFGGMSDEHKREQEYWVRAATTVGYETHTEYNTGNHTVLEIAITGRQCIGIEVQRSTLRTGLVKARATKSLKAGWQTIWSDNMPKNASWANHVPTVRPGRIDWSDPNPPPRTARAIGPRRLNVVRCDWGQMGPGCRKPCRKLHAPEFEMINDLTIDDVAELAPSGELVALQHRNVQYLVPPESRDRYSNITQDDGHVAIPEPRTSSRALPSTECTSPTHVYTPAQVEERLQQVDPSAALQFVRSQMNEYRRVARIAGCSDEYPAANECSQCRRVSENALIPWPSGWRCRICTYG